MSTYVWEQSTYSTDAHGDPVLIIYGRDTTTRKIKSFGVKGFKPYFFAESEEGDVVSCFNTPLKKVVCKHPQEIVKQRALYGKTFDADIPYDMRWFIDNKVYYAFDDDLKPVDIPVFLPKICYYDIEINIDETSRPDPLNPEWAIVAISVFDSYKKKIRCFTLCDHKVHKNQICFTSEKELLEAWAKYVHTNDFDVLAGWYNKGFDQPYIINRAIKIGANMSALSRVRNDKVGGDRIAGRVVADMLELFKEWSKPLGQQSSYDLKSISKNPLFGGLEYQDYGEHIRELIESDNWKTLVQYSINDVISLQRIDEKCGLFSYFEGIRRLTGIKLDDCLMKTRIIEYFLMRETGYPLPTRTRHDKEDFKGAMVVKPDVGIRRWVGAYDLSALYPSIIVAYNVSPDAFNIIPRTIVKMMEEREKLRARRLKGEGGEILATTEQSLKYVINSFYGVMGYPSFKLFSQECAKLIPEKGREINRNIHDFLSKKGFHVEYGDSVTGDTRIRISNTEEVEIQELFKETHACGCSGKEYYYPTNLNTFTMDGFGNVVLKPVKCVMRHKVSKQLYRVYSNDTNYVDVTEDHSIITTSTNNIYRQIKPLNMTLDTNLFILDSYDNNPTNIPHSFITTVNKIELLNTTDVYVYDLEVEDTHMFFANNILVHNTDSSYISTIDNPELGIKIEGEINDYLRNWSIEMGIKPELSPHIKLEKIYRNLFFKKSKTREGAAKKKYAGNVVWKDGHDIPDSASLDKRLDIKGFEIKRSDNSAITKEAMNDFFTKLLILDDEKGAVDGLKSIYFEVRRGQRSMLECAIPRDVKSDKKSPHKRGMVNSEMLLGVPWTGHSKPMLLYCAVPSCELCINEYNVTKVDPSYIKIDWPLQAEKTIRDKMETILESLGYKWETTIANQLTLADFM